MPKTMKRLDERATILQPVVTRDADGGPVTTYQTQWTKWCSRRDVTTQETRIASVLRSETTAVFTFNYFEGLTASHRIVSEGRTYDVLPPKEIGRKQYLEVQAMERIGQTT